MKVGRVGPTAACARLAAFQIGTGLDGHGLTRVPNGEQSTTWAVADVGENCVPKGSKSVYMQVVMWPVFNQFSVCRCSINHD